MIRKFDGKPLPARKSGVVAQRPPFAHPVGTLFDLGRKISVSKEQRTKILRDKARSAADQLAVLVVRTAFDAGKSELEPHVKDEIELNLSLNMAFLHSSIEKRPSRKAVVACLNSFVRTLNKSRKMTGAEKIDCFKVIRLNPFPEGWYFGNVTKRSIKKSRLEARKRFGL